MQNQPKKTKLNIFIPADTSGTGKWRALFPMSIIETFSRESGIQVQSMIRPSLEDKYYEGVTSVMYQRQISDWQEKVVDNFLIPVSNKYDFWTIYNIDDCMHSDEIPYYNRGRAAFNSPKIQENIKKMLNNSDFVCVTTNELKNYYNWKYGVPLDNIICIPNFLPRWWIGDYYDEVKSIENFKANKTKPRIGIISSLSHYNVTNSMWDKDHTPVSRVKIEDKSSEDGSKEVWMSEKNEIKSDDEVSRIPDDFDLVKDCILSTIDDFQWVLFGYLPQPLEKYVNEKKIEFHGGVNIMNYPSKLNSLKLNAIVAPLVDIEFNRCKSNIKYLEAAAIGVPLFAQDMITYQKYMDKEFLFKDSSDLKKKLYSLKNSTTKDFQKIISDNYAYINTPHNECRHPARNWWMEDNINQWMDLFSMRQKCKNIRFSTYLDIKSKEKTTYMYNDPKTGAFIKK